MIYRRLFNYITFIALSIIAFGCKQKPQQQDQVTADKGTYFSIKQFVQDQWNTFHGEPITFIKTVTENGKTDSSYVNAYNLEWGEIFKIFFASDISDKKYLNHYDFSMFEDDGTATRNFYYEAKDKDLFTRKLMISADQTNNKIRSIYIETQKDGWTSYSQKLYYAPMKVIQIQESKKPFIGHIKETVTEYHFLL
jgi:hypothetical protein